MNPLLSVTEIEKAELLRALATSRDSDCKVTDRAVQLCRRLCTAHDELLALLEAANERQQLLKAAIARMEGRA